MTHEKQRGSLFETLGKSLQARFVECGYVAWLTACDQITVDDNLLIDEMGPCIFDVLSN